jgi:hypothetical protein
MSRHKVRLLSYLLRLFLCLATLSLSLTPKASCQTVLDLSQIQNDGVSNVQILVPRYQSDPAIVLDLLGKYEYLVSWQGIPAASAELKVFQAGKYIRVVTKLRTNSAVDVFYKLRFNSESWIEKETLKPFRTHIEQTENGRVKLFDISFREDGEIYSFRSTNGQDQKEYRIRSSNQVFDPFSAVFNALAMQWGMGAERYFDTFTGKTRYLVNLAVKDKATISGDHFGVVQCFEVVPQVSNLTNPSANSKLRSAKIYVSQERPRKILKVVSKVFVGSVVVELIDSKLDVTPTSSKSTGELISSEANVSDGIVKPK